MFSPKAWVGHSFHERAICRDPKGQLKRLRNSAKLFGIVQRKVSCINLSNYDSQREKQSLKREKKKKMKQALGRFAQCGYKAGFSQRNKVISIFLGNIQFPSALLEKIWYTSDELIESLKVTALLQPKAIPKQNTAVLSDTESLCRRGKGAQL